MTEKTIDTPEETEDPRLRELSGKEEWLITLSSNVLAAILHNAFGIDMGEVQDIRSAFYNTVRENYSLPATRHHLDKILIDIDRKAYMRIMSAKDKVSETATEQDFENVKKHLRGLVKP
jgi:hypothetical protein